MSRTRTSAIAVAAALAIGGCGDDAPGPSQADTRYARALDGYCAGISRAMGEATSSTSDLAGLPQDEALRRLKTAVGAYVRTSTAVIRGLRGTPRPAGVPLATYDRINASLDYATRILSRTGTRLADATTLPGAARVVTQMNAAAAGFAPDTTGVPARIVAAAPSCRRT